MDARLLLSPESLTLAETNALQKPRSRTKGLSAPKKRAGPEACARDRPLLFLNGYFADSFGFVVISKSSVRNGVKGRPPSKLITLQTGLFAHP